MATKGFILVYPQALILYPSIGKALKIRTVQEREKHMEIWEVKQVRLIPPELPSDETEDTSKLSAKDRRLAKLKAEADDLMRRAKEEEARDDEDDDPEGAAA